MSQTRKGKKVNKDNKYDLSDMIKTKWYHDTFDSLNFSKLIRESLYVYSLEILNKRNGPHLETAYAID